MLWSNSLISIAWDEIMSTPPSENTRQAGENGSNWIGRLVDRHLRIKKPPPITEIATSLWVGDVSDLWRVHEEKYAKALLEQYKIYVEMADRISARRGLTNTFFLGLNTAVATTVGIFLQHPARASVMLALAPLLALLAQCLAWFLILRSYRQLNGAKYAVVGAMEQRLPSSPYWSAEWKALRQGEDASQYRPLSHVEQWIPLFFVVIYLTGFVALFVA